MGGFDTKFTEEAVCPFCGAVQDNTLEWFRPTWDEFVVAECDECGKEFKLSLYTEYSFSTSKLEVDE